MITRMRRFWERISGGEDKYIRFGGELRGTEAVAIAVVGEEKDDHGSISIIAVCSERVLIILIITSVHNPRLTFASSISSLHHSSPSTGAFPHYALSA